MYNDDMKSLKCTVCKENFPRARLIKSSSSTYKGNVYQYFRCNPCNTSILKKYRRTEVGKRNVAKAANKSYLKHRDKHKARTILGRAVKNGIVEKPSFCSTCPANTGIEAHHKDYSKPLIVMWLCRSCHALKHRV